MNPRKDKRKFENEPFSWLHMNIDGFYNEKNKIIFIQVIDTLGGSIFTNLIVISTIIYFFKVYNRNTRKKCETCSRLTIKTPEQRQ